MQTTSASLLMRLRRPGEPEAWERFVRLYTPLLHGWATGLGLQHADATDLVQDVFVTLVQKLPEFEYDDHQRFRGWLWVVTRNKWREKARRAALPVEPNRPLDDLPAADGGGVEEEDFRRYLLRRLLPTIRDRIPPDTWRVFHEYVVEGKPALRVAADLGVSVAVVYKTKVRVLAALHRELADLLPPAAP
jgi:RNA polymerase sigma factor (sigma-70 family)